MASVSVRIDETLAWLTQELPHEEAKLEAEILLQRALGVNRTYLRCHPETELSTSQEDQLHAWLSRRLTGEPLAYILGDAEFYGLTLSVSPAVLIPRQDTELLVDAALDLTPESTPFRILDMGTGSGAIAIAIASHRPKAQVTALDTSPAALAVAKDNACAHKLPSIRFYLSDWFTNLPKQSFELIVSNPPYIENDDEHLSQSSLPFEPAQALSSGQDGLDAIRLLCRQAPNWLVDNGWLIIEHGYNQGSAVRDLFAQACFSHVATHRDYGNNERLTMGQWKNHA
jgi:release factor glutamine methyltransferase